MKSLLIGISISLIFAFNAEAKVKKPVKAPIFSTKSYIVADTAGNTISEKDSDSVRPIASISKLMVALLASEQDMDETLSIPTERVVSSSIPKKITNLSRKELLALALIKSDNFAAQILCDNISNCVPKMNERAVALKMANTSFAEPTGLSKDNISTARDLVKLAIATVNNPIISNLSSMPKAEISIGTDVIHIKNTNPLTATMAVILSKTGFTKPAGGCLLMVVATNLGPKIFVLLGSKNTKTRVPDARRLAERL